MNLQLPKDFEENMTALLGAESEAFFEALLGPRSYGLRLNPLKVGAVTRNRVFASSLEATSPAASSLEATSPADSSLEDTSPADSSPEATSPADSSLEATSPADSSPEATSPADSSLEDTSPAASSLEDTSPAASSPEATSSAASSPDDTAPTEACTTATSQADSSKVESFQNGLSPVPAHSSLDSFAKTHGARLGICAKVPWADEGYYYQEDKRPGKSPFHEGGAFYIQEPSAMAVVQALDPKPGERICDLCAAPGGKTTHIAGRMNGQGVLISNEIVTDRAKILARNVERMGITNCIVTNEPPDVMAAHFSGYFHRIVVDAPCSGEGMFRKDDTAIEEWNKENVAMCAERQAMILDCAADMVMPGGTMVYSTCTFEPAEDELAICQFLERHSDWEIVDTPVKDYLSPGLSQFGDAMEKTIRIWPHKNQGEGHFLAKLVKKGEYVVVPGENQMPQNRKKKDANSKILEEVTSFLHTELLSEAGNQVININLNSKAENTIGVNLVINGDFIQSYPHGLDKSYLNGIRTCRVGLDIAEIKKGRIEPAHALAMSLTPDMVNSSYECSEDEAIKYLRGETLTINSDDTTSINNSKIGSDSGSNSYKNGSWTLVCIDGISLGWGKVVNGIIKNHYPKGLRRDLS